jgi:uncharacterized protein YgiM (DUF1202 family)
MNKTVLLVLTCLGFLAAPVWAQNDIRQETVQFQKGRSGASIKGRITGYETIDYRLSARAGQRMTVNLQTNNTANYFNILPPGSTDEAIFVGSSDGNRFEDTLPDSGDYRIRVYLMRSAARRGEKANYTLDIKIIGEQQGKPAATGGDFADGDAGGPDFWEVVGVPSSDTLNMRAGPAAHERVVDELDNGSIVRNLGCKTTGGQRWCRVARPEDPQSKGWVAGRFLRESSYQP